MSHNLIISEEFNGPKIVDRERLGRLEPLKNGKGGQGTVYAAPSVGYAHAEWMVYKEYNDEVIRNINSTTMSRMVSFPFLLNNSSRNTLFTHTAWPVCLVKKSGNISGVLMPGVPERFFFDMYVLDGRGGGNWTRQMGSFQHLLNDTSWLQDRGISLYNKNRYEVIESVVSSTQMLHKHDIIVGDLSPKNMLFSLKDWPLIYFLDCDSMMFRGAAAMPQFETPGWSVKAYDQRESSGTEFSDRYKVGLLALRLLSGSHVTYDVGSLPADVPEPVIDLIKRSIKGERGARPSLSEWNDVLRIARKEVVFSRDRVSSTRADHLKGSSDYSRGTGTLSTGDSHKTPYSPHPSAARPSQSALSHKGASKKTQGGVDGLFLGGSAGALIGIALGIIQWIDISTGTPILATGGALLGGAIGLIGIAGGVVGLVIGVLIGAAVGAFALGVVDGLLYWFFKMLLHNFASELRSEIDWAYFASNVAIGWTTLYSWKWCSVLILGVVCASISLLFAPAWARVAKQYPFLQKAFMMLITAVVIGWLGFVEQKKEAKAERDAFYISKTRVAGSLNDEGKPQNFRSIFYGVRETIILVAHYKNAVENVTSVTVVLSRDNEKVTVCDDYKLSHENGRYWCPIRGTLHENKYTYKFFAYNKKQAEGKFEIR